MGIGELTAAVRMAMPMVDGMDDVRFGDGRRGGGSGGGAVGGIAVDDACDDVALDELAFFLGGLAKSGGGGLDPLPEDAHPTRQPASVNSSRS